VQSAGIGVEAEEQGYMLHDPARNGVLLTATKAE
jgi:hypothetical protein